MLFEKKESQTFVCHLVMSKSVKPHGTDKSFASRNFISFCAYKFIYLIKQEVIEPQGDTVYHMLYGNSRMLLT